MPPWKIIGMAIAWAFAAGFIAVVTAILVAELLRFVGIVDSGDGSYGTSLNVVFAIVFVALLVVPVVFRRRFSERQPPPAS